MSQDRYQVLNTKAHGHLRIKQGHSKSLGDDVWYSMVFPTEMRNVQTSYPILFHRHAQDGTYFALALFGFQEGENLFLTEDEWEDVVYIPQMIRRQPLLIGFEKGEGDTASAVISVDMENPRVGITEGEPLFLENGDPSEYLNGQLDLLEKVHHGFQHAQMLTRLLLKHELLDPFALDVKLDSGEQCKLSGFYAINEDKLQALPSSAMHELNEAGALAAIFMIVASQGQFRQLVARKNRRSSGAS